MTRHIESEFLPEDHPDRLENSGISKLFIDRLHFSGFTRLTEFDDMSDGEILRLPNICRRALTAIREARERLVLPINDN
ncbi:MAG: hypothetical protein EOR68_24630 [Mesorhizobium sp.]|uniref:hypothetical protein n=1 Tax=Mesorhizobium sp. TaxID=1871066 RepID=UPI000FE9FA87|nr:hypothetical protein [Mesorhizobium sp.]RWL93204.1 MAG: hypothetical protein EOR68_24630 [Mesorhizobium sp.]